MRAPVLLPLLLLLGACAHPSQLAKAPVAVAAAPTVPAATEAETRDVDRYALANFVRARKDPLQKCYELELKGNPSLQGKVAVRFVITTLGRAGDVGIDEDTMGNKAVSDCLKMVVRSWVFPFKPEDDVPVVYPFIFSAAK